MGEKKKPLQGGEIHKKGRLLHFSNSFERRRCIAAYLKGGSKLYDKWDADKEKKRRYVPSITVTSCNIIMPLLTGETIITKIIIREIQPFSLSIQSNTFCSSSLSTFFFSSNTTLLTLL